MANAKKKVSKKAAQNDLLKWVAVGAGFLVLVMALADVILYVNI